MHVRECRHRLSQMNPVRNSFTQGGRGSEVRHRGVTVSVWGSEVKAPGSDGIRLWLLRFHRAFPNDDDDALPPPRNPTLQNLPLHLLPSIALRIRRLIDAESLTFDRSPLGTAGSRGFRVGYERGAAADERLPRRREGRRRAGRMAPPELAPGGSWVASAYRGMSADNIKGLVLALSSSAFIGASFIIKKKGLKKAAASGVRAGEDNFAS
ncbi:hypothetical protein BHE74_00026275 [Ensete ventricosum]|nr:hypothetical protein BHE74_00026275 [Ensete ventricosum]